MKIPCLSLPSFLIVLLLLALAVIIILISYWRHFHHFTYATIFLSVAILYFVIYQFYPEELVAGIFYTVLISGLVVFLIDLDDFLLLFKDLERKIKYCKHFNACPCGCGYGTCKHAGKKMINGKEKVGNCPHYEMLENVNRKVNV
ncbi:MAG: hypothetical protein ACTSP4_07370 [Candidatus Hodarchaeales archaeon]